MTPVTIPTNRNEFFEPMNSHGPNDFDFDINMFLLRHLFRDLMLTPNHPAPQKNPTSRRIKCYDPIRSVFRCSFLNKIGFFPCRSCFCLRECCCCTRCFCLGTRIFCRWSTRSKTPQNLPISSIFCKELRVLIHQFFVSESLLLTKQFFSIHKKATTRVLD